MTTTNVSHLKFNKLSENQYEATTPVDGEFYITPCPTYALDSEAVHKTGNETIAGTKTYSDEIYIKKIRPQLNLQTTEFATNDTEMSATTYAGKIFIFDKNNTSFGVMEAGKMTNGNNFIQWNLRNRTNESWTPNGGVVRLSTNDTTSFFDFPKCTSKATTTSSATANRVAVITQNYKSGANWYRVWSDGWIEQGGRASLNECSSTAYTLHRPFSDKNYFVAASQYNVSTNGDAEMGIGCSPTSTTQFNAFCHYISPNTMNFMWYACGY